MASADLSQWESKWNTLEMHLLVKQGFIEDFAFFHYHDLNAPR
jgi:hypothetical protein